MFSGIFSDNHQEFSTVHSALVTVTSAECTIENSWWWAEKMPENL